MLHQIPENVFYITTFDLGVINVMVLPEYYLRNPAAINAVDDEIPDTKTANQVYLSGALHVVSASVLFVRSSDLDTANLVKPLSTYYCPQDFEPDMVDEINRWFEIHQSRPWKTFRDLSESFWRFLDGENDLEPATVGMEIIWEKFYFDTSDLGEIVVVIGELATDTSLIEGLRFSLKNKEDNPEAGLRTYWGWHAIPSGNIEDAVPWLEKYSPEDPETFDDLLESFELFLAELQIIEMHPRALEKPKPTNFETKKPSQDYNSIRLPETTTCFVTGKIILLSDADRSSVSNRVAHRSLLIPSERTPSRSGLPDEIKVCSVTGKKLLQDELVTSDFSKKLVDSLLAVSSTISGRKCLPDELILCEESGIPLLPDETGVCTITGKRVNLDLLSKSELTKRLGLSRLLRVCPESQKSAFSEELVRCEVTDGFVNPEHLETCVVSGKRILRRLMIQCVISSMWVHRDLAVQSTKSWRWANPEFKATCYWSGQTLLKDETTLCRITGISFEKNWVNSGIGAIPLLDLVRTGPPGHLQKSQQANSIQATLGKAGIKIRAMTIQISPTGNCAAYYVDCSDFFGLRKRYAVGFILLGSEPKLLAPPSIGRLVNNEWITDI
jgi:hypothetical protein